jgi:hypothetical protein
MNVNNIMNLYCRTAERGYAEKETTMAAERWWKAPWKVVLTSTEKEIPYLDFTGSENQKRFTGPELKCLAGW